MMLVAGLGKNRTNFTVACTGLLLAVWEYPAIEQKSTNKMISVEFFILDKGMDIDLK